MLHKHTLANGLFPGDESGLAGSLLISKRERFGVTGTGFHVSDAHPVTSEVFTNDNEKNKLLGMSGS